MSQHSVRHLLGRFTALVVLAGAFIAISVGVATTTASAADSGDLIAITSPVEGEVLNVAPSAGSPSSIWLAGTYQPDGVEAIGVYIDGVKLECGEAPPGEEEYTSDCIVSADFLPDGTWTFTATEKEFDDTENPFAGPHTIEFVLIKYSPASESMTEGARAGVTFSIQVPASGGSPSDAPSDPLGSSPGGSSVSQIASGDPAAPSVLAATVSVQNAGLDVGRVLLTGAVTIILLLIVGYPGILIGNTLGDEENYERMFGRITKRWTKITAAAPKVKLPGWLPLAVGLTVATIIAGFVDPGFGFNLGSLRLLMSVAIAFVIQNVVGWWLVRRALRITDPDLEPHIRFRFGSIAVLIIAVVVSRLVNFEPGIVFGLLVGLSFGVELAKLKQARVVLVGAGYAFGLAIVGWLAYSLVTGIAGEHPGFWATFASETFSGLAVSGIASLPIALLPLALFEGGAIFAWKKSVWALAYGIGLFSFFVILMPLPFSWGEVGTPLVTWIALYIAYAVFAISVWAWFRFSSPHKAKSVATISS